MRLCKAVPCYRLHTATVYHRAIQGYTLVHNYIEQQLIIGLYKAIPYYRLYIRLLYIIELYEDIPSYIII